MATSLKLSSRRLPCKVLYNYVPACQNHKFKQKSKRPKRMEKRVFEVVTQPMYQEPLPVLRYSCLDPNAPQNRPEEVNPYEEFLLRELRKTVEENEMIIICQKLNYTWVRIHPVRVALGLKNMTFHDQVNTRLLRSVFENTDKENLIKLLHSHCVMITCPEINIKDMWNVIKKFPELIVMGGFCKDRLVTRDQIVEYSKLPPLDHLLGQLVASLNLAAGARTSSLLGSHQQTLSRNLEQYHKQLNEESEP